MDDKKEVLLTTSSVSEEKPVKKHKKRRSKDSDPETGDAKKQSKLEQIRHNKAAMDKLQAQIDSL
jgi:hypothetical protein